MQTLKRMIRSARNPIVQVSKRLSELDSDSQLTGWKN